MVTFIYDELKFLHGPLPENLVPYFISLYLEIYVKSLDIVATILYNIAILLRNFSPT